MTLNQSNVTEVKFKMKSVSSIQKPNLSSKGRAWHFLMISVQVLLLKEAVFINTCQSLGLYTKPSTLLVHVLTFADRLTLR